MTLWEKINHKNLYFYGLIALIIILYLAHLGFYPLFNPDEGRYAEIPREMLATGNFITPHLNGVEYFEKPALQYWFNAIAMAIFGETEFAVRLFPALTGLMGIFCTYKLGQKIFGRATGILAAILLATSFLYLVIAALNILDMAVAAFITLGLTAYYYYSVDRKKIYLYTVYIAMALGLLTKGLIGIVLVGGVVYCYLLLTRQWQLMWKNISLVGILIFLIIAVPWFYLVCQANSDFFHFFFIHEHFQRYLTKVHQRYEPFYFFIPCLIFGLMPWAGYLVNLKTKITNFQHYKKPILYLGLWAGLIFIFFSISDSKLVPYIVPCFPPLAILLAHSLLEAKKLKLPIIINAVINYLLAIALIVAGIKLQPLGIGQSHVLPLALVIIIGESYILYHYYRYQHKEQFISLTIIFALLFSFATWPVLQGMANYRTGKPVAQYILNLKATNTPIIMYKDYLQDLPFYTKQRIMLCDYKGELEFGSNHPSGAGWFINQQELKAKWNNEPSILVVEKSNYQELVQLLAINTKQEQIKKIGKYIIISPINMK